MLRIPITTARLIPTFRVLYYHIVMFIEDGHLEIIVIIIEII